MSVPRIHAFQDRCQSRRFIQSDPRTGSILSAFAKLAAATERVSPTAKCHRDSRHFDAVEKVWNSEREARLPS